MVRTEADVSGVVVESLLDRRHDLVLARADLRPLFTAWRRHAHALELLPPEPACRHMEHLLAAVTLYLTLHPPDEFVACTLNLLPYQLNLFASGDNSTYQLTGRVYTRNVKTTESSRLFLESQRPRHQPRRSTVDVEGESVLVMFEQYYWRSEQISTRLFSRKGAEFVMLQGLPAADRTWLRRLEEKTLADYLQGDFERIETRRYSLGCGCHPKKILAVVHGIYQGRPEELFAGQQQVEVSCPRCGRRYWLSREDFDRGPGGVGAA